MPLIYNHIPTAFPWYDKLEKQVRYQENCDNTCDYKLISPNNALLPFQFKIGNENDVITAWEILDANLLTITNISAAKAAIKVIANEGGRYWYYNGSAVLSDVLALKPGFYYSVVTLTGGKKMYSEVFNIPFDSFPVGGVNKFVKLEWYSTCSISPYFYGDTVNGVPYFRNVAYLDTYVQGDEPEILEETEEDGEGNEIPVFQRAIIRYRIPGAVANYLKTALVVMQMHDVIILTTPMGIHSGEISKVTTASATLDTGCLSTVDIIFEQDLAIIRRSCC